MANIFNRNKKSKLCFGDRVAVLNNFLYQYLRREYMILGLQPALESLEVAVAAVQIYIGTQDVATVQCIIPLIKLDSGRQL